MEYQNYSRQQDIVVGSGRDDEGVADKIFNDEMRNSKKNEASINNLSINMKLINAEYDKQPKNAIRVKRTKSTNKVIDDSDYENDFIQILNLHHNILKFGSPGDWPDGEGDNNILQEISDINSEVIKSTDAHEVVEHFSGGTIKTIEEVEERQNILINNPVDFSSGLLKGVVILAVAGGAALFIGYISTSVGLYTLLTNIFGPAYSLIIKQYLDTNLCNIGFKVFGVLRASGDDANTIGEFFENIKDRTIDESRLSINGVLVMMGSSKATLLFDQLKKITGVAGIPSIPGLSAYNSVILGNLAGRVQASYINNGVSLIANKLNLVSKNPRTVKNEVSKKALIEIQKKNYKYANYLEELQNGGPSPLDYITNTIDINKNHIKKTLTTFSKNHPVIASVMSVITAGIVTEYIMILGFGTPDEPYDQIPPPTDLKWETVGTKLSSGFERDVILAGKLTTPARNNLNQWTADSKKKIDNWTEAKLKLSAEHAAVPGPLQNLWNYLDTVSVIGQIKQPVNYFGRIFDITSGSLSAGIKQAWITPYVNGILSNILPHKQDFINKLRKYTNHNPADLAKIDKKLSFKYVYHVIFLESLINLTGTTMEQAQSDILAIGSDAGGKLASGRGRTHLSKRVEHMYNTTFKSIIDKGGDPYLLLKKYSVNLRNILTERGIKSKGTATDSARAAADETVHEAIDVLKTSAATGAFNLNTIKGLHAANNTHLKIINGSLSDTIDHIDSIAAEQLELLIAERDDNVSTITQINDSLNAYLTHVGLLQSYLDKNIDIIDDKSYAGTIRQIHEGESMILTLTSFKESFENDTEAREKYIYDLETIRDGGEPSYIKYSKLRSIDAKVEEMWSDYIVEHRKYNDYLLEGSKVHDDMTPINELLKIKQIVAERTDVIYRINSIIVQNPDENATAFKASELKSTDTMELSRILKVLQKNKRQNDAIISLRDKRAELEKTLGKFKDIPGGETEYAKKTMASLTDSWASANSGGPGDVSWTSVTLDTKLTIPPPNLSDEESADALYIKNIRDISTIDKISSEANGQLHIIKELSVNAVNGTSKKALMRIILDLDEQVKNQLYNKSEKTIDLVNRLHDKGVTATKLSKKILSITKVNKLYDKLFTEQSKVTDHISHNLSSVERVTNRYNKMLENPDIPSERIESIRQLKINSDNLLMTTVQLKNIFNNDDLLEIINIRSGYINNILTNDDDDAKLQNIEDSFNARTVSNTGRMAETDAAVQKNFNDFETFDSIISPELLNKYTEKLLSEGPLNKQNFDKLSDLKEKRSGERLALRKYHDSVALLISRQEESAERAIQLTETNRRLLDLAAGSNTIKGRLRKLVGLEDLETLNKVDELKREAELRNHHLETVNLLVAKAAQQIELNSIEVDKFKRISTELVDDINKTIDGQDNLAETKLLLEDILHQQVIDSEQFDTELNRTETILSQWLSSDEVDVFVSTMKNYKISLEEAAVRAAELREELRLQKVTEAMDELREHRSVDEQEALAERELFNQRMREKLEENTGEAENIQNAANGAIIEVTRAVAAAEESAENLAQLFGDAERKTAFLAAISADAAEMESDRVRGDEAIQLENMVRTATDLDSNTGKAVTESKRKMRDLADKVILNIEAERLVIGNLGKANRKLKEAMTFAADTVKAIKTAGTAESVSVKEEAIRAAAAVTKAYTNKRLLEENLEEIREERNTLRELVNLNKEMTERLVDEKAKVEIMLQKLSTVETSARNMFEGSERVKTEKRAAVRAAALLQEELEKARKRSDAAKEQADKFKEALAKAKKRLKDASNAAEVKAAGEASARFQAELEKAKKRINTAKEQADKFKEALVKAKKRIKDAAKAVEVKAEEEAAGRFRAELEKAEKRINTAKEQADKFKEALEKAKLRIEAVEKAGEERRVKEARRVKEEKEMVDGGEQVQGEDSLDLVDEEEDDVVEEVVNPFAGDLVQGEDSLDLVDEEEDDVAEEVVNPFAGDLVQGEDSLDLVDEEEDDVVEEVVNPFAGDLVQGEDSIDLVDEEEDDVVEEVANPFAGDLVQGEDSIDLVDEEEDDVAEDAAGKGKESKKKQEDHRKMVEKLSQFEDIVALDGFITNLTDAKKIQLRNLQDEGLRNAWIRILDFRNGGDLTDHGKLFGDPSNSQIITDVGKIIDHMTGGPEVVPAIKNLLKICILNPGSSGCTMDALQTIQANKGVVNYTKMAKSAGGKVAAAVTGVGVAVATAAGQVTAAATASAAAATAASAASAAESLAAAKASELAALAAQKLLANGVFQWTRHNTVLLLSGKYYSHAAATAAAKNAAARAVSVAANQVAAAQSIAAQTALESVAAETAALEASSTLASGSAGASVAAVVATAGAVVKAADQARVLVNMGRSVVKITKKLTEIQKLYGRQDGEAARKAKRLGKVADSILAQDKKLEDAFNNIKLNYAAMEHKVLINELIDTGRAEWIIQDGRRILVSKSKLNISDMVSGAISLSQGTSKSTLNIRGLMASVLTLPSDEKAKIIKGAIAPILTGQMPSIRGAFSRGTAAKASYDTLYDSVDGKDKRSKWHDDQLKVVARAHSEDKMNDEERREAIAAGALAQTKLDDVVKTAGDYGANALFYNGLFDLGGVGKSIDFIVGDSERGERYKADINTATDWFGKNTVTKSTDLVKAGLKDSELTVDEKKLMNASFTKTFGGDKPIEMDSEKFGQWYADYKKFYTYSDGTISVFKRKSRGRPGMWRRYLMMGEQGIKWQDKLDKDHDKTIDDIMKDDTINDTLRRIKLTAANKTWQSWDNIMKASTEAYGDMRGLANKALFTEVIKKENEHLIGLPKVNAAAHILDGKKGAEKNYKERLSMNKIGTGFDDIKAKEKKVSQAISDKHDAELQHKLARGSVDKETKRHDSNILAWAVWDNNLIGPDRKNRENELHETNKKKCNEDIEYKAAAEIKAAAAVAAAAKELADSKKRVTALLKSSTAAAAEAEDAKEAYKEALVSNITFFEESLRALPEQTTDEDILLRKVEFTNKKEEEESRLRQLTHGRGAGGKGSIEVRMVEGIRRRFGLSKERRYIYTESSNSGIERDTEFQSAYIEWKKHSHNYQSEEDTKRDTVYWAAAERGAERAAEP